LILRLNLTKHTIFNILKKLKIKMEEKEIIEIIKELFTINSICKKVYGYSNKGTIEKIKKK